MLKQGVSDTHLPPQTCRAKPTFSSACSRAGNIFPVEVGGFLGDTYGDISPGASPKIAALRAFMWEPLSLLGFLGVAQLGPGRTPGGWKGCFRKTEDGGGWWQGRRTSFVS